MGELVIPFGLLAQTLPTFDHDALAKKIGLILDRGDTAGATRLWLETSGRARRVLARKGVPEPVREALIRELSAAVRLSLFAHRGSIRPGRVPPKKRPTEPTAKILQMPVRSTGAGS